MQVVLVEEAADVIKAHVLATLAPNIDQLLLIGDLTSAAETQAQALDRKSTRLNSSHLC
jgi:hypothetical protein